jgi:hypothetical protein
MDSQILMRLNEIYRHNVYNEEVLSEETLSEEELVGIEEWVEALIEEGYDLDQFSDEELYEAYLSALDEAKMDKGKTDVEKRVTRKERLVSGGNLSPGMQSKYNSPKYTPEDSDDEIEVGRQWAHRRSRGMKKPEAKSRPTHSGKYGAMQRRRGMNEELDLYDIVSEYLVSEGFCDSYEDADVIMANMSEEWRESIMEEVLDEANRPEREMIKKGLLKPGRQVARIRNLNRQSGNTNWYAADPGDTRAIKSPGKGGVFNSRQRQEQEADAFNTSRRRMEHEFDQDSSRARKTGDWSKFDKKRPLGGHKTRFEKEREERNNRSVYGD